MIGQYIVILWPLLAVFIYYILVRYHESFFSLSQLFDTSPVKYFIGRWFVNIPVALAWSFLIIVMLGILFDAKSPEEITMPSHNEIQTLDPLSQALKDAGAPVH